MPYVNVLIDDEKYAAIKAQAKINGMPVYRFLPMIIEEYGKYLIDSSEMDNPDPFDFGNFGEKPAKTVKNSSR